MRLLGLVNSRRRRGCCGSLSGLRRITGRRFRLVGKSLKDQFVLLEFFMSLEEFSITVAE